MAQQPKRPSHSRSNTLVTHPIRQEAMVLLLPSINASVAPITSAEASEEELATTIGQAWIGIPVRFQLVQRDVQVEGYQEYAVEKWITERRSPVTVLVVHTGDTENHKITLTSLAPWQGLSQTDAHLEWNKALHHLRKAGARPRETPSGVLLSTSLAHFRSDYTIIRLPSLVDPSPFPDSVSPPSLLAIRSQLYTNINLVRMSCAGRGAVGLAPVTDTSRERFASMYSLPTFITESRSNTGSPVEPASPFTRSFAHHHALSKSTLDVNILGDAAGIVKRVSRGSTSIDTVASNNATSQNHERDEISPFNATVLELVKLLQSALEIFGMYGVDKATGLRKHKDKHKVDNIDSGLPLIDGLLCDVTVEGLKRWVTEIGEPCVGIEPTELTLDPTTLSALLSLVLSTRNKLAVLGYTSGPTEADIAEFKDPFIHPRAFQRAVASFLDAESKVTRPLPHFSVHSHGINTPESTNTSVSAAMSTSHAILTAYVLEHINNAYDRAESSTRNLNLNLNINSTVQRVFLNKPTTTTSDGDYDAMDSDDQNYGNHNYASIGSQNQLLSGLASGLTGKGMKSVSKIGSVNESLNPSTVNLGIGIKRRPRGVNGKGPTCILAPVVDLNTLIGAVGAVRVKTKGKDRDKLSGSLRAVAGSVRGVWTGRALSILNMREMEGHIEVKDPSASTKRGKLHKDHHDSEKAAAERKVSRDRGVASDGNGDDGGNVETGRTTEDDESDVFGNALTSRLGKPWSGRVQKKIESWAGLGRWKGQGIDIGNPKPGRFPANPPVRRNDSPPSIVFTGAVDRELDDEDLLSSGQASPVSEKRKSFDPLTTLASAESSAVNLNTFNQLSLAQKRPHWKQRMYQSRVSSWSDPVSARIEDLTNDTDDGGPPITTIPADREASDLASPPDVKNAQPHTSLLSRSNVITGYDTEFSGVDSLAPIPVVPSPPQRANLISFANGSKRRRSFHDLASYRETTRVLPFERMKIDADLCGQLLIMTRRDQHLGDMLACLQTLTSTLSATNTNLRADYDRNAPALSRLDDRTKVITAVEAELTKSDMAAQERETLLYEAQQFQVPELWHMANAPRQKVHELREKVFGTGGRRLPQGMHGAHGMYNRLQWTLDGKERLVDQLGRTESEVEEESTVDPRAQFTVQTIEDEDTEIVEHPRLKPTWLLRFFTIWGARNAAPTMKLDEDNPKHSPVTTDTLSDATTQLS